MPDRLTRLLGDLFYVTAKFDPPDTSHTSAVRMGDAVTHPTWGTCSTKGSWS